MAPALVALVGWTLFAFAGAYRWTLVPLFAGVVGLAAMARPRIASPPHTTIDLGLIACLAAIGSQIVPVPAGLRGALSPAAREVDRTLLLAATDSARPLSLDPHATAWALATGLTAVLAFWSARTVFERGGLRRVSRGISLCGLVLVTIAFVQHARTPHLIYGFWPPITRTATPTTYGPFVNRNDFATWLLLALPLVVGGGLARLQSRWRGGSMGQVVRAVESTLDTPTVVMTASVALMTAGLVASLSRSGLAGGAAAVMAVLVLGHPRLGLRRSLALLALTVAVLLVAAPYANLSALAGRLGDSLPADVHGRVEIWRSTWPMARDFAAVGTGVGAFERGMLVYQQAPRLLFFNHAHNEFLQLFAEGGLLVGVPAAWTFGAACLQARRQIRADRSAVFWLRVGAAASLVAVAVQSVWDTGLRMPANAVLFAIVAAVALHDRTPRPGASSRVGENGLTHPRQEIERSRKGQAPTRQAGRDGARSGELRAQPLAVRRVEHEALRHQRERGVADR